MKTSSVNGETDSSETRNRKAFLDLLLDQHLNGGDLTEEGIREEVDTFMFEGHDTTAMALSWILFYLGHHQHVQEKLWPEIDQLFDELESERDDDTSSVQIPLGMIKDLQYLDCVVKEGLRLCPSVPFIGRRLHEDTVIPAGDEKYTVPAGTILYVFIYMLHRDAETFPSPETFDPDRFLPENITQRNAFAFVPFSAGKCSHWMRKKNKITNFIDLNVVFIYSLLNLIPSKSLHFSLIV